MILLDTHVLIWLVNEPAKLSKRANEAILAARESDGLAISAITLWELAWFATHRQLDFVGTVNALVERITSKIAIRPITPGIAILANQLPSTYSNDASDRLIGATAIIEGMVLITNDQTILHCKQVRSIW